MKWSGGAGDDVGTDAAVATSRDSSLFNYVCINFSFLLTLCSIIIYTQALLLSYTISLAHTHSESCLTSLLQLVHNLLLVCVHSDLDFFFFLPGCFPGAIKYLCKLD